MHILLTGGTGLIGRALCAHWHAQGHRLTVWNRQPERVPALCAGAQGVAHLTDIAPDDAPDVVVNLAGAPIADRPWTPARRRLLWASRVALTDELVGWMGQLPRKPQALLSASAVGWYGDRQEQELDENSPPPAVADFGSTLCQAWEAAALRAQPLGVRVALLRIAPVLAPQGGMLARLRLPFWLGLGGRLGSGAQWMPWVHRDDVVGLFDHVLHQSTCQGVYNACAPGAVRNAEFTQALAAAWHRPAFLPAPAWALRLLLGEMAVLLLGSQRVQPQSTAQAGYSFRHPELGAALRQVLQQDRTSAQG